MHVFIIFLLSSCITDEKSKCHKEKREKVEKMSGGFSNCEINIISFGSIAEKYNLQDFLLTSCLLDYSVYQECKDESPIAPTVY